MKWMKWDPDVNDVILEHVYMSKIEAEIEFWLEVLVEHDKCYDKKWEPIYTDHIHAAER